MQTKALEKLQRFASKPGGQVFLVVLTLAVSLLIRLLLFRYHGYYIDENSFKAWYNTAAEKGPAWLLRFHLVRLSPVQYLYLLDFR